MNSLSTQKHVNHCQMLKNTKPSEWLNSDSHLMIYQPFATTYQCKLFTPVSGKQWGAVILSSVNYLHQLFSHRTAQTPPTELRFVISHCWWIVRLEIRKAAVPEGPKRQGEKEKCLHPRSRCCLLSAKRGRAGKHRHYPATSQKGIQFLMPSVRSDLLEGEDTAIRMGSFSLQQPKGWVQYRFQRWSLHGGEREEVKGICHYCATCRIAKACPQGQRVFLLLSALICKKLQSYSHRETPDRNILLYSAVFKVLINNWQQLLEQTMSLLVPVK